MIINIFIRRKNDFRNFFYNSKIVKTSFLFSLEMNITIYPNFSYCSKSYNF